MRVVYDRITGPNAAEQVWTSFALSAGEWELLGWLRAILASASYASKAVSPSKEVSISRIVPIYSALLDVLSKQLVVPGNLPLSEAEKSLMQKALDKAYNKLRKYYLYTNTNPWYMIGLSK